MGGTVWLPSAAAALVLLFSFGRWFALRQFQDRRVPVAIGVLAVALAIAFSNTTRGQSLDVLMPPDEFIHPFNGKVVMMYLPHTANAPLLSLSHHSDGVCAMWLPKIGDPDISEELYRCLMVIEVANCNGATDINTPAVKARASFAEQARYGRSCLSGRWDPRAYEKIQLRAAGH